MKKNGRSSLRLWENKIVQKYCIKWACDDGWMFKIYFVKI